MIRLSFPSDTNQSIFTQSLEELGIEAHEGFDDRVGSRVVRVEDGDATDKVMELAHGLGGLEV